MGCIPCRQDNPQKSLELAIPEEGVNIALFSEAISSVDLPTTKANSAQLHNRIKESKPFHVKLATDRGNPRKGILLCTKDDLLIIDSKGAFDRPEESVRFSKKPKEPVSAKIKVVGTHDESPQRFSSNPHCLWIDPPKDNDQNLNPPLRSDSKRSIMSYGSFAFDSECLVVEKKGSIYKEYKIVDVLGRGSFGEVKKVLHRVSGKAYAMKVINKSLCSQNTNIMNEIEILKKLDHPNIVRVYEFAQDKKFFYLMTEYCAGGELLNKIMSLKTFSEYSAAKIMRQLLSAVAYCHARHIVHRDLKPENLVLENDDIESNMKVIDFGTSTIFKPTEKMREIMGTAFYIAPEVIKGYYTEKCDIWSCGVIMYVLLSGTPPFFGHSNEEVMRKVEKGNVSFLSAPWKKVSSDAISLIKKMLTYRPDKRITAEEALNDIWIMKFANSGRIEATNMLESMQHLQQFKAQSGLQKAVLSYMTSHFISSEQEKKARQVFEMLDTNGDGQLSKEELFEGYKILLGDVEEARRQVDEMMAQLDMNKNGTIDYKEFLVANFQQEDITNQKMLKQAFDFFDADGNGQISTDEIKRVFSICPGDKIIRAILRDADLNNDGQISFEEFVAVMKKYVVATPVLSSTALH